MDILEKIVEQKKLEVAAARQRFTQKELRAKALKSSESRSFYETLKRPGPAGINIIAEIKRASPSKGPIRNDLDPVACATAYEQGGAAALSVLTDGPNFQGSAEDLKAAKTAAKLPVLRKDFLISAYQIYESKVMGADAVLLITRILSKAQLKDLVDLSRELDMDALVEVHTEADLESAMETGATLVGINNRNLRSFETSIQKSIELAGLLKPHQVAVAESGIKSSGDIAALKKAGIWNFLIGESLVRAKDPKAFLRYLMSDH
jgi:indole-3-glycerol phosphate synthase